MEMPKGVNPNSHGNNPPVGEEKKIRMPDRLWNFAQAIAGYSKGVRLMCEVATGTKGILWAVPLQPINIDRAFPIIPHEHCTLWYGCDRAEIEEYIGTIFTASIVGVGQSDRIQAAQALLPAGIPFVQSIPHITLSYCEGVAPVESAEMLQTATEVDPIEMMATFRIEFFEFQP